MTRLVLVQPLVSSLMHSALTKCRVMLFASLPDPPQVLFESTGRGKSKSVELEDVKFHQCVRLSRSCV